GYATSEQSSDRAGADSGLRIGGRGGSRHRAPNCGVAPYMNVRLRPRPERHRIDRGPTRAGGDPSGFAGTPGPLVRNDVGNRRSKFVEVGYDSFARDVDRCDQSAIRQCDVLKHAEIKRLPCALELALHREGILGVKYDHLRPWFS